MDYKQNANLPKALCSTEKHRVTVSNGVLDWVPVKPKYSFINQSGSDW